MLPPFLQRQAATSRPDPNRPQNAKMRYVAAYLLAALGGNDSPNSKDLKKILDSVGIECDDYLLKVIGELSGKNMIDHEDVIAQGSSKLASMPAGGAVAVAPGADSAASAAAGEKKEEKREESEKSDDDMGFGLFD